MEVRVRGTLKAAAVGEVGIGPPEVCCPGSWNWLIEVWKDIQVVAARSHIRDSENRLSAKLLLDVEVPLMNGCIGIVVWVKLERASRRREYRWPSRWESG